MSSVIAIILFKTPTLSALSQDQVNKVLYKNLRPTAHSPIDKAVPKTP